MDMSNTKNTKDLIDSSSVKNLIYFMQSSQNDTFCNSFPEMEIMREQKTDLTVRGISNI